MLPDIKLPLKSYVDYEKGTLYEVLGENALPGSNSSFVFYLTESNQLRAQRADEFYSTAVEDASTFSSGKEKLFRTSRTTIESPLEMAHLGKCLSLETSEIFDLYVDKELKYHLHAVKNKD